MSELPEIDQSDAPEGHEYRWEPERDVRGLDWRVVEAITGQICRCSWGSGPRHPSCGAPSVAKLNRGHDRERWWYYCAEHLYGRVLVDGVIYLKVLRPIAHAAEASA